ncbi:Stf0 family sulfotransferase [Thalassococcus sp. S3]|uniref:Stf0 family sulfotransferase n=1 Tax=Thalassococcus sp. S3 TaxID=2017482 RepID=UPI00102461E7|nr:Stf0 family sulfotransferase [Thalassococcus sp. S3]QBF30962.1 sulfotransferase [Thalassococcus sp. S3]
MTARAAYIICATPRSGSTLLCRLLGATGVAGHPHSYFHRSSVEDWARFLDIEIDGTASQEETLRAVLAAAIKEGSGQTDMFGLRLMRKSFDFFMDQLDLVYPGYPNDVARIEAAFGPTRYIRLTRADKAAQAVSVVKAIQTGLWHKAPDGTEIERLSPHQEPCYDPALIQQHYDAFQASDDAWAAWFDHQGLQPLHITYEALSANPLATVARVLRYLGRDPAAARELTLPVAKLADATSQSWIDRFKSERLGGPGPQDGTTRPV